MRRALLLTLVAAALGGRLVWADVLPEVDASIRRLVLTASRTLTSEGYQARDTLRILEVSPEGEAEVPVFLVEGNEYGFLVGDSATDGRLIARLRDLSGEEIAPSEAVVEEDGVSLLRFVPKKSGSYLLVLSRASTEAAVVCVGYVYR